MCFLCHTVFTIFHRDAYINFRCLTPSDNKKKQVTAHSPATVQIVSNAAIFKEDS